MKQCKTPGCTNDQFYHDRTRADRLQQHCKTCSNKRRKERHKRNPEAKKKKGRRDYFRCKREVMDHYGKVCQCCGEPRLAFLTLDHVNQDGAQHRRDMTWGTCTGYGFYLWLRKNNWPKDLGLQVLCANCNSAKGYKGQCPHQLEREYELINGDGI